VQSIDTESNREDNLTIYYTNADSLLNKKDELYLELRRKKPDILVITETLPKACNSLDIDKVEMQIDGYELMQGQINNKSRGVSFYFRNNLSVKECHLLDKVKFEESCWCIVQLNEKERMLLGGIYRSPSSVDLNNKKLVTLINSAVELNFNYTVIVGDFNFPSIDWTNLSTPHGINHPDYCLIECVRDNFLTQMVDRPTRYRHGQNANILDLILTDKPEFVDKVEYSSNLGASDHVSLFLTLNCMPVKYTDSLLKRNFHKGDYEAVRKDLEAVDWSEMNTLSVEKGYQFFLNEIEQTVQKNVPRKKINSSSRKSKWATNDCLVAIRNKKKAWKSYIHTKTTSNYDNYCRARNKCTVLTRAAKRRFEKVVAESAKSNPKSFWSYVREKTKSRAGIPDLKNVDNENVSTNKGKADILNTFFASVFVKEPAGQIPIFDVRYQGEPITRLITDQATVRKGLCTLNVGKSMGPDHCHPKLLRETADILSEPLSIIFNRTFEDGCVPTVWKDANISAIYKNKGSNDDPSNYRPVSLTCIPCKLCERTVRETIVNHMNNNNLFSDSQFGFRNKRNCVLQLIDVLDDWTKAYDAGKQIDTIYLDIKKAFDTVPHKRLLHKLEGYGIGGEILEWVADFLKNRRQRVVVKGEESTWENVTSGIPQGSVLGPVLFIIYINDMPDTLKSVCKIFADDSKIYQFVSSPSDQLTLQEDLLSLCDWSEKWLLEFSIPKCKSVNYGLIKHEYQYSMRDSQNNNVDLPSCSEEKDLGIWFENSLKFNKHVQNVVNRTNRLTGMIRRTFKYMDRNLFLTLYKSLIRSIVDFGIVVWYPSTKKNIQLIENIQRRATRIVPQLRGLSYKERLSYLMLPTLLYRRERYDLIQMFKIVNRFDDVDPEKFFSFNDNTTRGHIFRITKPQTNKTLRLNTFPVRCINSWNNLPEDVVLSDSVLTFKTKLDKLWWPRRYKTSNIYSAGTG